MESAGPREARHERVHNKELPDDCLPVCPGGDGLRTVDRRGAHRVRRGPVHRGRRNRPVARHIRRPCVGRRFTGDSRLLHCAGGRKGELVQAGRGTRAKGDKTRRGQPRGPSPTGPRHGPPGAGGGDAECLERRLRHQSAQCDRGGASAGPENGGRPRKPGRLACGSRRREADSSPVCSTGRTKKKRSPISSGRSNWRLGTRWRFSNTRLAF